MLFRSVGFSERIAEHFGFAPYFDVISGSGITKDNTKYDVIRNARDACQVDMADAVIYIMRSDHVLSEVINELELLGVTETQIRSGLTVKQYNATQILEMTLTWQNADEGLAIWEGVIAKTNELLHDTTSCAMCRRMIINSGIVRVVARIGETDMVITDVQEWIDHDESVQPKAEANSGCEYC